MKKFFCHPILFQDLSLSVDQLTESEGDDSFTIDSSRLPTAIDCAFSGAAAEYLRKLPRSGLVQVFAERGLPKRSRYYETPKPTT